MFDITNDDEALERAKDFTEYIKNLFSENYDFHEVNHLLFFKEILNLIYYNNAKSPHIGILFKITEGEEKKLNTVNILDRSEIILQDMYKKSSDEISLLGLFDLISTSNSFLENDSIKLKHKINLLDSENMHLQNKIPLFIDYGEEELVYSFINIRYQLICDLIKDFNNLVLGNTDFSQDIEILIRLYNIYLNQYADYFIHHNKIFQLLNFLKSELKVIDNSSIKKIIIRKLIEVNSSFLVEPKSYYTDLIEDSAELFVKEELDFLKMQIDSNPMGMLMKNLQFTQGSLSSKSVSDNNIVTVIRFTIPFPTEKIKEGFFMIGNIKVEFQGINNVFKDPIFQLFRNFNIGGMGWHFFSDGWSSKDEEITTFNFIIPEMYSPDFQFANDKVIELDFSEKTALMGRDFFPHKEFVIRLLLNNYEIISEAVNLPKDKVNVNLISNFLVDYFNTTTNTVEYRRLYGLTNPDSYTATTDRFIEKLNELNLSDQYISITELANQTELVSDKALSNFLLSLIKIVVKNNVELHSNYKYFWKENIKGQIIPQKEPDMQPLIMSQLKVLCDYMGIQISREVESGNGEVDFLCSATYKGKVIKTCIELKNAHSPKIEAGLTLQLPQYLKSERTRHGIYLVLWYKGELFDKPKNYDSPQSLKDLLDKIRPEEFKTEVILINCNKPTVPSRLK